MPSECKKCGNKDNYNFALNIGLCDTCISSEIEAKDAILNTILSKIKEGTVTLEWVRAYIEKALKGDDE